MARSEGSFVRWQAIRITQMGYAVNLILTFAAASLGFVLTLVKDQELRAHPWGACLLVFGGLSFMISITAGIWCVLNRLEDFRESAQIAREREKFEWQGYGKPWINDQLRCQRCKNRKRGECSKTLFNWQVVIFGLGVLFLTMAVVVVYHQNLLF